MLLWRGRGLAGLVVDHAHHFLGRRRAQILVDQDDDMSDFQTINESEIGDGTQY